MKGSVRNRTSSIGRNSTPTSSKARWIALAVAGSGGRRSSSKLSTALSLTEAVLASLPTDQPSRVRAERLWALLSFYEFLSLPVGASHFVKFTKHTPHRKRWPRSAGRSRLEPQPRGRLERTAVLFAAAGVGWGGGRRRPACPRAGPRKPLGAANCRRSR